MKAQGIRVMFIIHVVGVIITTTVYGSHVAVVKMYWIAGG